MALAPYTYRWKVEGGRQWRIQLDVFEGKGVLQIFSPRGRKLADIVSKSAWTGVLPKAGSYTLRLVPKDGIAAYDLEVDRVMSLRSKK